MHSDSATTTSIWMATADAPSYPPLNKDTDADVCVVGAGISGLTTAYLLAREGRSVVVLDHGPVGGGETGRTTAHLVWALDDFYSRLEHLHGAEGARIAAESHRSAVDQIEKICKDERIACDFERVNGYWVAASDEDAQALDGEAMAAIRAGAGDVERQPEVPGLPFTSKGVLRFGGQGQMHPIRYLAGMARAIERHGGRIYCGSHVDAIEKLPHGPRVRTSDGHHVTTRDLVVATNSPINDWVAIHTKQVPYRTYVVGLRISKGTVPRALYWDTLDPYHYIRVADGDTADSDVLLVGGEDHRTGQAHNEAERFAALEQWTRERFPTAATLVYHWSGQVMEPTDGVAFIGKNPGDEHIFIITGDSGNGMTHGTIGGMLLTGLIVRGEHPWETLYRPSRISLRSSGTYLREAVNIAAQFAEHITPGDVSSPDAIQPGSGAVMRDGIHKLAVYKDEHGALHVRSAVCPHLFCVVAWNDAEKSWDCPCHGSRFDAYGKVVTGPATSDLPVPGGGS